MANKPPVHVIPRKNGWAAVREGNERATSVHRTQSEAAKEGRDIARRDETGFLLHANDGRVRDSSDYGTSTTEGAQERAASEDQRQDEDRGPKNGVRRLKEEPETPWAWSPTRPGRPWKASKTPPGGPPTRCKASWVSLLVGASGTKKKVR